MKTVLIAIGGNALFDTEGGNNVSPLKMETVCRQLVDVIQLGYQPIIVFGNGPQVGNLLEMTEKYIMPPKWPIPLDVCVAWTQSEIGYYLEKELINQLRLQGVEKNILGGVTTTVVVDGDDPAFLEPTKPVGHFYTQEDAEVLELERGWTIREDSNRGYRRVVPSPLPLRIIEAEAIQALIAAGTIVMCGGGGGIPVMDEGGRLQGVEAVIDKDYTSSLLAKTLGIQELVICTAVDKLCLHFGTPEEVALDQVTVNEIRRYIDDGHFPPGSMGPKVKALAEFVESGGEKAIITQLENLTVAMQGKAGTAIVKT